MARRSADSGAGGRLQLSPPHIVLVMRSRDMKERPKWTRRAEST